MDPDVNTSSAVMGSSGSDAKENGPPTLAEPASGPVAEMSGALPPKPATDAVPTTAADPAPTGLPKETSSNKPQAVPTLDSTEDQVNQQDTEMKEATEAALEAPSAALEEASNEANGTTAARKGMNGRRKSGGVPEHKSKKLNKKKSMPKMTHLDAQPGEYYFARLKSYPPWPSIICDEDMLPESLLTTRPITTKKADGSYNEAYADGGKKVTDRTFPIMFLHTNEFAWIPNTELSPLNPEDCKDVAEKGKSKALLAAYEVAAEGHNLQYFKELLTEHANAMAAEEQRKEELAAEKAAKAERKKRKSEAKVEADDIDMEDADDTEEVKKSTKKRKKVAESEDEEPEKPAKTPKTTKLKLTTSKTPSTEKKAKEKVSKPRAERKKSKAAASDEEMADAAEEETEKPMDPEEARQARGKEVLFLRHRLQKGFLSRDQIPQEEDMPQMSNYIKKLENYEDLEVSIIRETKINKVLKALVKLNAIPRDEEFNFRKRSVELLGKWNKILGADATDGEPTAAGDKDSKLTPTTNGVHEDPSETKRDDIEVPAENEAEAAEVEKKVEELDTDSSTKARVTEHIQEDPEQSVGADAAISAESKTVPTTVDSAPVEKDAEPVVVEKAPESAEGAAEALETVKPTE